jgi:hypothetical protein
MDNGQFFSHGLHGYHRQKSKDQSSKLKVQKSKHVFNCQLSTVNYQLSTVNCQLSINYLITKTNNHGKIKQKTNRGVFD